MVIFQFTKCYRINIITILYTEKSPLFLCLLYTEPGQIIIKVNMLKWKCGFFSVWWHLCFGCTYGEEGMVWVCEDDCSRFFFAVRWLFFPRSEFLFFKVKWVHEFGKTLILQEKFFFSSWNWTMKLAEGRSYNTWQIPGVRKFCKQ